MTTLEVKKITMPAAGLNGTSTLPLVAKVPYKKSPAKSDLSESDGLWVGYESVPTAFPYKNEDRYDRQLVDREFTAGILENDYLKATVMPNFGGKLWSLIDKTTGRELFFSNPVVRYCNLALRNAWTSGGTEFNIGAIGHHPFTCDTMFTATTKLADGTPVLRVYEYERIRGLCYQIDFWLPETSRLLYVRVRVYNPSWKATAMYWWSNIAVPEIPSARAIAPCDDAYTFGPKGVYRVNTPMVDGIDVSYSTNLKNACDFFYRIPEDRRRYVAHIDDKGYGLVHVSTQRLKARKMFVWGQGAGGAMWQKFLSGNGCDGKYLELQAGVGNTQAEQVPMPPKTAWEWLEGYGAMNADPAKCHDADYHVAQAEVEEKLAAMVSQADLEQMLTDTHDMATSPADVVLQGSGWGALENARRVAAGEDPLPAYLDYGKVGEEQKPWLFLLENGFMEQPCEKAAPLSYMKQEEWIDMMEAAVDGPDAYNWYTWYLLGCAYLSKQQFRFAEEAMNKSMSLKPNCWAEFVLACIVASKGDKVKSARMTLSAASMNPEDESLGVAAVNALMSAEMYKGILDFTGKLSAELASVPRIRLCRAIALLRTGEIDAADELLNADGGIEMTDIKEGEVSITDFWYELEEAKAKREGKEFDRDEIDPPQKYDFRMHVGKAKKYTPPTEQK